MCKLCSHPKCSLFHILCNCPSSLYKKRYEWRHDSVLRTISIAVLNRINEQNSRQPQPNSVQSIRFIPEGSKPPTTRRIHACSGLISRANDWQCLVDYSGRPIIFPPSITATEQRPDIVIWSELTKTVLLIELTVPNEDTLLMPSSERRRDTMASLTHAAWPNGMRTC